ncbi:MAG: anaerobic ribonucleoside-triphosphate reductase, partial [Candidatus Thermoplasmatota archaeon]|nr:anaerobic ribonucleoside-triphosphate reductase [Candidatus Thermoplasmatota archaeon]
FENISTGYDAHSKRVPEIIMNSPWYIIKEFMLGMFRGDGHNSDKIDLHLCNRNLIDDIFILGLRIGTPFEKYYGEDSYSLRLTSNLAKKTFLDSVPFSDNVPTVLGKSFDFYERIPTEPFNITREDLKVGHWNRCQIGKRITSKRLDMSDEFHSRFLQSDLHTFEVKIIEETHSDYVYDLVNVENYHNFLTSDGIFSSNCCAFLMPLETSSDKDDMLNGTVRGGSLQVVTINLPQIAYESDKEESRLFQLIDERMDVAKQVMLLRKDLIEKNLKNGMLPFLAQKVNEKGDRYYEPSKQSFTIGMVGINEMVKYCTGSELHENQAAWMFGLKVMKHMKDKVAKLREETGLNFALARTPAESTAYRFATIDKRRFPSKAVYQGDPSTNSIYYTNSFHVRPNADVPLFQRMNVEGSFHPLTDGGAMSHVWLGDTNPDPEAVMKLTKDLATKTAIQYMAFTKDLTICNSCGFTLGNLVDSCPSCQSKNVQSWSRITGYYQNITGWNKGKLQELKDRRRYGL